MHYMYLCCRLPISNVQVQFFFVPTTVNVHMYSFLLACTLYIQLPPFVFFITQYNQLHSSAFLIAYGMHVIRGVCVECGGCYYKV